MKLIEANCRRTCSQNKQVMLSTPRPIALAWAHSAATWYSKLDGGGGGCNCNAVTLQCATVRVAPAYWALIPRLGCRSSCVTVSCCNALHGCTFHAASPPLHFVLSDACICFVHTASIRHQTFNSAVRCLTCMHAKHSFQLFSSDVSSGEQGGGPYVFSKTKPKSVLYSRKCQQLRNRATPFCALPPCLHLLFARLAYLESREYHG